jgi:uncharacterized damage-inducible protein DinB
MTTSTITRERQDLLETLAKHRGFLRQTIEGMSDEQIRATPTVSALSLGAIVKHVTAVESMWREFIHAGAEAFADATPEKYAEEWTLGPEATAEHLLAAYAAAATVTDEVVATVADLDAEHALPEAPWFPPNAKWSARRVLLHIIAETAQHAGHADVIRESIDGSKTMG